jgi:hypothetical protein
VFLGGIQITVIGVGVFFFGAKFFLGLASCFDQHNSYITHYRLVPPRSRKQLIPFFREFNGNLYITLFMDQNSMQILRNLNEVPIDFHDAPMSRLLLPHTYAVAIQVNSSGCIFAWFWFLTSFWFSTTNSFPNHLL